MILKNDFKMPINVSSITKKEEVEGSRAVLHSSKYFVRKEDQIK